MKIMILCSDGPHNKYLISRICSNFDDVKIFVEPGNATLLKKRYEKKYHQYLQLKYQSIRRKICGSDRTRKNFFRKYLTHFSYNNYNVTIVDSINSPVVEQGIQNYSPDIGIVMGTSIIHEPILKKMGEKPLINIHGGYLPYYKGNHCFFFACYNNEYDKIGSTIHFVNKDIDAGDIIEHIVPNINKKDSPELLYCKAEKQAVDRMVSLLLDYKQGKLIKRQKQEKTGRLYYTKDRKLIHDIKFFIKKQRSK